MPEKSRPSQCQTFDRRLRAEPRRVHKITESSAHASSAIEKVASSQRFARKSKRRRCDPPDSPRSEEYLRFERMTSALFRVDKRDVPKHEPKKRSPASRPHSGTGDLSLGLSSRAHVSPACLGFVYKYLASLPLVGVLIKVNSCRIRLANASR